LATPAWDVVSGEVARDGHRVDFIALSQLPDRCPRFVAGDKLGNGGWWESVLYLLAFSDGVARVADFRCSLLTLGEVK
jgi:hypothetical protein